jgi:hypothetical protein
MMEPEPKFQTILNVVDPNRWGGDYHLCMLRIRIRIRASGSRFLAIRVPVPENMSSCHLNVH